MAREFSAGAPMIDKTHDWNHERLPGWFRGAVDETIRDGIQAPRAPSLSVEEKIEFLALMESARLSDVILGMITPNARDIADLEALMSYCVRSGYRLQTWVLSRSRMEDLVALRDLKARSGCDVGMNVFISLSDIRQYVEGWNLHDSL